VSDPQARTAHPEEPGEARSKVASRALRDPRLWTVVLAVAWFLCGFGAGHLVASRGAEPRPAHARYAEELCEAFELTGLRRSALVDLLDQREVDRAEVRRRHEERTLATMEPDLREIDRRVERTIRDTIIPPSQRARFDRLARPLLLESVPSDGRASTPAPESPDPNGAPAPAGGD